MTRDLSTPLTGAELSAIRDAVPALDLLAIRSLRRAGFAIVRQSEAPSGESGDYSWGRGRDEVSSAA